MHPQGPVCEGTGASMTLTAALSVGSEKWRWLGPLEERMSEILRVQIMEHQAAARRHGLEQMLSSCGMRTRSINITQELVRNANSWAPAQV